MIAPSDGLRDALRSFADISTVHITPMTADLLDRTPVEDWPVGGYRGPYGYMLYVADELMDGAPDDLRQLFDVLRGHVDYVLIDRDASQLDELPDYAEAWNASEGPRPDVLIPTHH